MRKDIFKRQQLLFGLLSALVTDSTCCLARNWRSRPLGRRRRFLLASTKKTSGSVGREGRRDEAASCQHHRLILFSEFSVHQPCCCLLCQSHFKRPLFAVGIRHFTRMSTAHKKSKRRTVAVQAGSRRKMTGFQYMCEEEHCKENSVERSDSRSNLYDGEAAVR